MSHNVKPNSKRLFTKNQPRGSQCALHLTLGSNYHNCCLTSCGCCHGCMTVHRQADTTQGPVTGRATYSSHISMSCGNNKALQQTGHSNHRQSHRQHLESYQLVNELQQKRSTSANWSFTSQSSKAKVARQIVADVLPNTQGKIKHVCCAIFTPLCGVCSDVHVQGMAEV